jgi:hypothetical protein
MALRATEGREDTLTNDRPKQNPDCEGGASSKTG